MDLYQELGVDRTATQEEIKRAYKRLAMKHHPDRGGDVERLSKINAAYTVLKDPQKRAEYDNPAPRGFGGYSSRGPDINSVFDDFFNMGSRGYRMHKNQDLRMQTVLSLRDCFTGKQFTASYQLPNGDHEEINVNIPAGVTDGDVVRVPGRGDNSFTDVPRGDVHIQVRVKPEPGWDVHGHDLLTSTQVNVFDLTVGISVTVATLNDKKIKIKIPAGTQPDSVFSVSGHGLPIPNANRTGNLHVKVKAFVPKITDKDLQCQLEDIKNAITEVS